MNMLKMCLNWKVVAGLTAVGIAVAVVAPQAALALLPLLLLAVCPLSMLLMAGMGMRGMGATDKSAAGDVEYTCPMHPQVRSSTPGRCPTCRMALVPAGSPGDQRPEHTVAQPQVAELKERLATLQDEQAAIARELGLLEARQTAADRQALTAPGAADDAS